jgi:hypothetical protein
MSAPLPACLLALREHVVLALRGHVVLPAGWPAFMWLRCHRGLPTVSEHRPGRTHWMAAPATRAGIP